jgi:hypothetical protein
MNAGRPSTPKRAQAAAQPSAAPRVLTVLAAGLVLALGATLLLIGIGTAHAVSLLAGSDVAGTGDFALVAVSSVLASALVCVTVLRRQLGQAAARRDTPRRCRERR